MPNILDNGYTPGQQVANSAQGAGALYGISALNNVSTNNFIDTYSPKLAFSLQAIGDTSNPIVRLRESVGGSEIDFYADASGWLSPQSTGSGFFASIVLSEWCAGKDCLAVKWYNQAKNTDGTRYVNDLMQNTAALQPKIWDATTGFIKASNGFTPCFKQESGKLLTLQTALSSKNFSSKEFSIFLTYDNINVATTPATSVLLGGSSSSGVLRKASGSLLLYPKLGNIEEPNNSYTETGNVHPLLNNFYELHVKNDTSAVSGKKLKTYINNSPFTNIDIFNDSDLTPANTYGIKLLPAGQIGIDGIRINVGQEGIIPYYDSSQTVGGGTNYVGQHLNVSDFHIDANIALQTKTNTSNFGKVGSTVRLVSTVAPSSAVVINGKTYTSVQITGQSLWILTENLDSTIYPNGSAITEVTTDANWTASTSGVRRKYENIFGTYYNTYAINTIIAQGGYSAGGVTWTIPTVLQAVINLQLGVSRFITRGGTSKNLSSRAYMYQLSDAEFAAAGNIGRWSRSEYFIMNYEIGGIYSTDGGSAAFQEFIVFDTSVDNVVRDEIVESRNRSIIKYDYGNQALLNRYPGSMGAYSLRKLNNTTSKALIQIRRDDTGALSNVFYTVLDKLNTDYISSFCAGTTCRISKWYDQSGLGRHLVYDATLVTPAPVIFENGAIVTDGGEVAIKFSNIQGLYTEASYTVPENSTIFTVFRKTSGNNIDENLLSSAAGSIQRVAATNNWIVKGINSDSISLSTGITGATESILYINSNTTGTSNTELMTGVNSDPYGYIGTGAPITQDLPTKLGISADINSLAGFTGFIKEIILYGNNKSADRFEIQNNINNYYNIYNELTRMGTPAEILPELRCAYSLRLVNGNYAGALIKIRRASDSQEVDVFPDLNGEISLNSKVSVNNNVTYPAPNVPNLGQFLNAVGYKTNPQTASITAAVTTWYDQSGNGDNITNSTVSQQPTLFDSTALSNAGDFIRNNTKPGVLFNNVNLQKLYSAANVTKHMISSGTDSSTTFAGGTSIVFSTLSGSTSSRPIFVYGDGGTSLSNIDFRILSANTGITNTYINTVNSPISTAASITEAVQYINIFNKELTRLHYTIDGYVNTQNTFSGTAKRNLAKIQIGAYINNTTANTHWNGILQEVLHFKNSMLGYNQDIYRNIYNYYKPTTSQYFNVSNILDSTTYPATSNAYVAYSLRSVTGNLNLLSSNRLIRVRRASDNIEVDVFANKFGYLWYDSKVTNVVESTATAGEKGNISGKTFGDFASGATCTIVTWYDQSGNGRDLTQTTSSLQPTIYNSDSGIVLDGIRPAIKFNGTNNRLQSVSGLSLTGTITGSFTYSSAQTSAAYLLSGAGTNHIKFGRLLNGTANTDTIGAQSFLATSAIGANIAASSRTAIALYTTTAKIRAISSSETSGTIGTIGTTTQLYIGTSNSFDSHWNGKVQEIILWNVDEYAGWSQHILQNANYYHRNYRS